MDNDKELFESTLADDASVTPIDTATPEPQQQEDQGQLRDENGRFAAKQNEPSPQPQPEPAPQAQQQGRDEANVPSWRLREEREAREAAERRFNDSQAQWQRQIQELQSRLPKPEPAPRPDLYEDPNAFVDHGVRQAIDPIKNEIGQLREFYSRRDAERDHGPEKVKAAYEWIAQGMAQRDPEAIATYQRAMQSMHPFGDLVQAHQQRAVFQQTGGDLGAYFSRTLEEQLKDPKFAGEILAKIQQSARGPNSPQVQQKINLPPSLNRVASAMSAGDDNGDVSDGALFAHAMR